MIRDLMNAVANYFTGQSYLPTFRITDFIEIIFIAFLIYEIIVWIKNTKAWMLLKGILVLAGFILLAALFRMYTVLWIVENLLPLVATAVIIIFQPELRRALEKLGEKKFLSAVKSFDARYKENSKFSERTVDGIVEAVFAMGSVKTGALIVVEREIVLSEYERTGIELDCLVSKQILINIFEHNTPLHDGAIIVRGDRIVSATCYLPLSDSLAISKDLGTRHRAAIGMSEVSDALVIVVSEETGRISVVADGNLVRGVDAEYLKARLEAIRVKEADTAKLSKKVKGWRKNGKKAD